MIRQRWLIQGRVQGVGFRPFLYRITNELNLSGFVKNHTQGVCLEIQGTRSLLDEFKSKFHQKIPARARIDKIEYQNIEVIKEDEFRILESLEGPSFTMAASDVSPCDQCIEEMNDKYNRRYRHLFISCIDCGPRYSIIEKLPYDRERTVYKNFQMCFRCEEETLDPKNRRFHSQTNSCHDCGPQVSFLNHTGEVLDRKNPAILSALQALKLGHILAVKGVGGFQLWVDASNEEAVKRLRLRKNRPHKAFALMALDLRTVKNFAEVSMDEENLLLSLQSPIVLLQKKNKNSMAASLAPGLSTYGFMLPASPLQRQVLSDFQGVVVATSANLSEEPICRTNEEALSRLKNIADYFLLHDRDIVRALDDSMVQCVQGERQILRCARGYAPIDIDVTLSNHNEYFALGSDYKNAFASFKKQKLILFEYAADLGSHESKQNYHKRMKEQMDLVDHNPQSLKFLADQHPDFYSSLWKQNQSIDFVQHHEAHVASVLSENQNLKSAFCVSWDGTGYSKGEIWGGEFFQFKEKSLVHLGSVKKFKLLGGDQAIKNPEKILAGLVASYLGHEALDQVFDEKTAALYRQIFRKNLSCVECSSVGRIFDAVSFLLGQIDKVTFEGQAAMYLQAQAEANEHDEHYDYESKNGILDLSQAISLILKDRKTKSPAWIARAFHNTLIEALVALAQQSENENVILCGGVFQNKLLLEGTMNRLQKKNLNVFRNKLLPANDSSIAIGQIFNVLMKEI